MEKAYSTKYLTETPVSFKRLQAIPLDKFQVISSLTNINNELPVDIRYDGMGLVYCESDQSYYYFKGGTTNAHFIKFSDTLQGVRTYDATLNTTKDIKLEINHNLNASNIIVSFMHNDEMLLLGWKRGMINGTDLGNYIHISTDANYSNLKVFIISKDLAPTQPLHPNLDNELSDIQTKLNTTHTNLDTLQEIGDSLVNIQTSIGNNNNTLTTTWTQYTTIQQIGDVLNTMSNSLRPIDTVLSVGSTNLIENKAVAIALNTKIGDAPNDTSTYGRKGLGWVAINNVIIDTVLNITSTNAIENKAVSIALNTKIGDAPNDTNTYARKGLGWTKIQSNLKEPSLFTFTLSNVSSSGLMTLHSVSPDGTDIISKVLDTSFIGSTPLTKDDGWTNYINIVGSKLVISYVDITTAVMKLLVFDDFYVDDFNNTFMWSNVRTLTTSVTMAQYTTATIIQNNDDVYVVIAGTPTVIKRYTAHDFIEVGTFTFPSNIDWNNGSQAKFYGDYIYFVAGNNNYTGICRVSRIKRDFSSYEKVMDINQNGNSNTLPGAGMLIVDSKLYIIQTTLNDTKFYLLKFDISDLNSTPTLLNNVQHNFVAGNNRGLAYGITYYGNRIFIPINWIGTLPSNADRQLWSMSMDDLSVIERLTLADNSGLLTISESGSIIWSTVNQSYSGDTDAKLYSIKPMDITSTPTILLDIPTTERFNAISLRRTDADKLRENGYVDKKISGYVSAKLTQSFTLAEKIIARDNIDTIDKVEVQELVLTNKFADFTYMETVTAPNFTQLVSDYVLFKIGLSYYFASKVSNGVNLKNVQINAFKTLPIASNGTFSIGSNEPNSIGNVLYNVYSLPSDPSNSFIDGQVYGFEFFRKIVETPTVQYLKPTVSGATTNIDISNKVETIVECDLNMDTDFALSNFITDKPSTIKFVLRRAVTPNTINVKFSGVTRQTGINLNTTNATLVSSGIPLTSSDALTQRRYFIVVCDILPHPTVSGQTVMVISHGISQPFII